MTFLENKYTKWYWGIVNKASAERRERGDGRVYQLHHILPSSLGGSDDEDNKVLLTPREHFICHMLLTRMTEGRARSKMVYAFFRFRPKGSSISSLDYAEMIEAVSGEMNAFYGKKHSEATRKMISANHGMRGTYAYKLWVERHGVEEAEKRDLEMRKRRSVSLSGNKNPMWRRERPLEWRVEHSRKMSGGGHPNFGKKRAWVNRENETRSVLLERLPAFLAEGWKPGRK